MKKIAVILSGCGVYDGSEIHESVLTLLEIEQAGAEWTCFAPDINQLHVVNHKTGEESPDEVRNVLVESARISRGRIENVSKLNVVDFDALIVPGGFGAAKNLSDFAINGVECRIDPDVLNACRAFAKSHKPAGYLCIAPTMLPLIYGNNVNGTIGNDPATAAAFQALGGKHIDCSVMDIVYDESNNVYSTPAYMLATSISEAHIGIQKLVQALIKSI